MLFNTYKDGVLTDVSNAVQYLQGWCIKICLQCCSIFTRMVYYESARRYVGQNNTAPVPWMVRGPQDNAEMRVAEGLKTSGAML